MVTMQKKTILNVNPVRNQKEHLVTKKHPRERCTASPHASNKECRYKTSCSQSASTLHQKQRQAETSTSHPKNFTPSKKARQVLVILYPRWHGISAYSATSQPTRFPSPPSTKSPRLKYQAKQRITVIGIIQLRHPMSAYASERQKPGSLASHDTSLSTTSLGQEAWR